ncbi:MAG: PilN domain-containing protein [Desulfobacteraceae bacterium]|nr:PilN domain-containing protein [Desulfobacteraceae bacterium]
MIQINLLPARTTKRKESARQFIAIFIASVLVTGSIIGFLWYWQENEIVSLEREIASLKQEVAKFAQYEAMMNDLKKKKAMVDKKRTVIEDLQKDRDAIVRILALLSVQIPADRMSFERLVQVSNTITLEGQAASNEAIVEFMRNLESSPYVEKGSVSLTQSRQSTAEGNRKIMAFQITYKFLKYSEVKKRAQQS